MSASLMELQFSKTSGGASPESICDIEQGVANHIFLL